ncbi:acyl-CoA dehydrogenase family protein [Actibacterium lipolyticum]|uniref:Acryloyl-CoA reductase (NADH) n=1 Tax=Actibacterium lipolyticum TaxID=1524263 RepID=A0A238KN02_9RHOB|nr:acyl-CoA dehydrogenase family protein [Actibacterium lipolyticum]SMX44229.1 Acryloyl-CoA reductase (NADH) [Actibacterium lipolyticum]
MDFSLTEDRQMLSDTLNRYLAEQYPAEHRIKVAYDAPFHDATKWAELAELGVLGALAPENVGGFGGAGFDITVVFEALGRAMCPEPMLGTLMASRLLAAAGEDQEALLDGSARYAVAIGEIEAPYELDHIATTATGETLSGRKSCVYGGNVADVLLVAARNGDDLSLYAVQAADAQITGYGLIDGGGAAEVMLDATPARLILQDAKAALEDALDAGALALCAEAVGLMDVTNAMLLDYLRQRKQFGRNIGSFQALQHRCADLAIEIEQARSITIFAASRLEQPDRARAVSMAKNLIGRAAKLVAEESTQMHGGIGMTWEYPGSHYTKRLVMLDHQLGDTDFHLERVMRLGAA